MTKMHDNQVPTSPELVRHLLQSQFPSLADEAIAETPLHGTDNDVYRVGRDHSVRLPIIDWSVAGEERIRPWLPWLKDRLDIGVPVPVYYGSPAFKYPHRWTIYPWFQGKTLQPGIDDPEIATQVAQLVQQMWQLPTEGAPPGGRTPHAFDTEVRASLAQFHADEHREVLTEFWDGIMRTPAWDGSDAVWIHGDIQAGNLIFRDNHLVAAIDWSGLGVGDPVNDLQIAWNTFGPTARTAFRETLAVDDQTWQRARGRCFIQACFQLPYYRETFPIMANQAKYVFRQIMDELATKN